MMTRLILIFMLLGSSAASAAPLAVEALFDSKSRIPGALIPFRVAGDLMATGTLLDVQASSSDGVDCRAMIDPHYKDVFHVKCAQATSVIVKIRMTAAGEFYEVSMIPVQIKFPVNDVVVIKPPPADPDILAGKQLFNTFCINCHQDPTAKKGRTATQIGNAIDTRDDMKSLRDSLNTDQLNKLAKYLQSL